MHCDNGRVEKRDAFFPYEDRIGRAGGSRGVTETIQQRSQASTRCSAPVVLSFLSLLVDREWSGSSASEAAVNCRPAYHQPRKRCCDMWQHVRAVPVRGKGRCDPALSSAPWLMEKGKWPVGVS